MSAAADRAPHPRVEELRRTVRRSRLAARAPGHLASAVLVVLLALALRSILLPPSPAAAPARPAAGADAPSEDLALRFARAYLTYDAADPAAHQRSLAPYLPGGIGAEAGFSASAGSRRVAWEDVASDQPSLQGGRVITVAAQVSGSPAPLYLALTVRHRPGRPLSLVGYPALVGAPAISTSAPEPAREAVSDPEVSEVVERVLRNYLAGAAPDLRADLTDDAQVTLPTVSLAVRQVSAVDWVAGPGSGAVLATASAEGPEGAGYTLTYELGIAWRERPYVDFIEVVPTRS
jgi:Conjugative transposon protein TcpC